MEFFKAHTRIPFMKQRHLAMWCSTLIFIASLTSLFTKGLSLGLDFTGGVQVTAQFDQAVSLSMIRTKLHQHGLTQALVRADNTTNQSQLSIRIATHPQLTREQLKQRLSAAIPSAHISEFEYIGPEVGKELISKGILAIVIALIATMAYIAVRFDYRFALSAAIALIHDPILILGIFSFFHVEFNMIVLTAVLTVIGYSLNDTIVVYDRVRENFRTMRRASVLEIMNASINQTLSRTIMTSGLTLLVVIALLIYGGISIHGFALALIIGIIIGTYSSIYIAGSLAMVFGLDRRHFS